MESQGFQRMITQTGFDPRRDLQHLLLASVRQTNDRPHSIFAVIARGTPSTEPEVRAAPADRLLRDFYNLYEIPVAGPEDAPQ